MNAALTHKAVAATTETTDRGEFSALAATWSLDRTNERIVRGAFKSSLEEWAQVGRRVPLHWDHKGEAENVIGSIDPTTMAERDDGLFVEGQLDITDSAVAREVWRLVKGNGRAELRLSGEEGPSKWRRSGSCSTSTCSKSRSHPHP
jgi:hypothetical protein